MSSHSPHLPVIIGVLHDLPPDALHGLVALALHRQLPGDVLRVEDGLQVEPGPLAVQPLLQHLLGKWGGACTARVGGTGLGLVSMMETFHPIGVQCRAPTSASASTTLHRASFPFCLPILCLAFTSFSPHHCKLIHSSLLMRCAP